MSNRQSPESETNTPLPLGSPILPADAMGRVACLLIGCFFGTLGVGSLAMLVSNRRGFDATSAYELSTAAALFGACLVLWALLTPRWLVPVAHHVVSHLFWIILVLFIPVAIHALILLLSGKV